MVKITPELMRKRSEHNESVLWSLEEIALHQFKIRKIENIAEHCRHLQILLLQSNKITKLENLNRLKELRYLNLAVNRIQVLEGLDECESLEKLDLTANYIYDYHDVDSLSQLEFLADLYLIGNPCTSLPLYRPYVITALPRLQNLDGQAITRTERIEAAQLLQVSSPPPPFPPGDGYWEDTDGSDYEDDDAGIRVQRAAEESAAADVARTRIDRSGEVRRGPDGRVMQFNDIGFDFWVDEDPAANTVCVCIKLPKFMNSSAVGVDLHPTYVDVTVKDKTLRVSLPREVHCGGAEATRAASTGVLRLRCPTVDPIPDMVVPAASVSFPREGHDTLEIKEQEELESESISDLPSDLPDLI
eukprot:gnl/Dysnectes_brevis/492_a545_2086.p1 GENE.gnl/Dysnectes_brevis/492_a545_2086~~gnl/Dysnectes_brevis/492_a545_2086.p1  ORF type:complete len:359 (+),score=103.61 gnl/Dysnectes_brevis/492_a545_2086:1153-2229(+)